jgi:hypothetical protein
MTEGKRQKQRLNTALSDLDAIKATPTVMVVMSLHRAAAPGELMWNVGDMSPALTSKVWQALVLPSSHSSTDDESPHRFFCKL